MNPYVRVSYDSGTHSLLWLTKRFERLFIIPQSIISYFAHMPHYNQRRLETDGDMIHDRLWVPSNSTLSQTQTQTQTPTDVLPETPTVEFGSEDTTWQGTDVQLQKRKIVGTGKGRKYEGYWEGKGHYVDFVRVAGSGGYCGLRQLTVLKEGPLKAGEGNWDNLRDEVPPLEG